MELPRQWSALLTELHENGSSFRREFRLNEQRTADILKALQENAEKAKKLQDETNNLNNIALGLKALGAAAVVIGAFNIEAPLARVGQMMASQAIVWHGFDKASKANIKKALEERDLKKRAVELGEEFMAIVRLLRGTLEEMKKVSDQMMEKSAMLNTSSGQQAKRSVTEIDEFQRLLTSDGGNAIDFVVQLAKQCSTVVKELHEMKTSLQELENA